MPCSSAVIIVTGGEKVCARSTWGSKWSFVWRRFTVSWFYGEDVFDRNTSAGTVEFDKVFFSAGQNGFLMRMVHYDTLESLTQMCGLGLFNDFLKFKFYMFYAPLRSEILIAAEDIKVHSNHLNELRA